uniref:Uncharacterized protein n=1 Tax=Alexandrium catenella TaxID=2925 RepID=A0A7S1WIQ6_ALECA
MVKKRKKAVQEEGAPDASVAELNQVLLSSSALPAKQPTYNGAKLTLELLEATTTSVVRRMGWFRDVRLRRAAEGFMRGCKMHQQASEREGDSSRPFEKPSHSEIQAYEEQLKEHIQQLQSRMKVAPMNDRREINVRAGPAKPAVARELAKLKELKERAAEREKKPKSVIKGPTLQKKRRAGANSKAKEASKKVQDSGGDEST